MLHGELGTVIGNPIQPDFLEDVEKVGGHFAADLKFLKKENLKFFVLKNKNKPALRLWRQIRCPAFRTPVAGASPSRWNGRTMKL